MSCNLRPNEHPTGYTSLPETTSTTTTSSSSQPTTTTTDLQSGPITATKIDPTAVPTTSATEPSAPDTSNPLATSLDPAHVKPAKPTADDGMMTPSRKAGS